MLSLLTVRISRLASSLAQQQLTWEVRIAGRDRFRVRRFGGWASRNLAEQARFEVRKAGRIDKATFLPLYSGEGVERFGEKGGLENQNRNDPPPRESRGHDSDVGQMGANVAR